MQIRKFGFAMLHRPIMYGSSPTKDTHSLVRQYDFCYLENKQITNVYCHLSPAWSTLWPIFCLRFQGILGETAIPTVDEEGLPIMKGLDCIRGQEDDYVVSHPLDTNFSLNL